MTDRAKHSTIPQAPPRASGRARRRYSSCPPGQFRRELLPPARAFYPREFGSALGKERRGWAQTKCCFHDGHSKTSLALNMCEGHFRCFSCGARGADLIAFVRLRYKLDFRGACQYLNAWDSGFFSPHQVRQQQLARERQQIEEAIRQQAEHRQRIEARGWLRCLECIYAKTNSRLSELQKGAPEAFPGERETCWGILADSLPQIRTAEDEYFKLAGVGLG
jgi:CHC2-type zinc finger protein